MLFDEPDSVVIIVLVTVMIIAVIVIICVIIVIIGFNEPCCLTTLTLLWLWDNLWTWHLGADRANSCVTNDCNSHAGNHADKLKSLHRLQLLLTSY